MRFNPEARIGLVNSSPAVTWEAINRVDFERSVIDGAVELEYDNLDATGRVQRGSTAEASLMLPSWFRALGRATLTVVEFDPPEEVRGGIRVDRVNNSAVCASLTRRVEATEATGQSLLCVGVEVEVAGAIGRLVQRSSLNRIFDQKFDWMLKRVSIVSEQTAAKSV